MYHVRSWGYSISVSNSTGKITTVATVSQSWAEGAAIESDDDSDEHDQSRLDDDGCPNPRPSLPQVSELLHFSKSFTVSMLVALAFFISGCDEPKPTIHLTGEHWTRSGNTWRYESRSHCVTVTVEVNRGGVDVFGRKAPPQPNDGAVCALLGIGLLAFGAGCAATYLYLHDTLTKAHRSPKTERRLAEAENTAKKLANTDAELAQAQAKIASLDLIQPGEELTVTLPGSHGEIAVQVANDGTIALPDVGRVHVAGLPLSILDKYLEHLIGDLQRVRTACHSEHERALTHALVEARQSFEQRLRALGETVPTDDDWQKLHEHYRRNHLRASRHGRLISVVAHGDPSGAIQLDWKIVDPPPAPYRVTVKENEAPITTEWSNEGRVNRIIAPGRDYAYTFEVYEGTHANAANLEAGFGFVVSAPTEEQWSWSLRDPVSASREALERVKREATEQKDAEAEIDALGLPPDDTEWIKARYNAERRARTPRNE